MRAWKRIAPLLLAGAVLAAAFGSGASPASAARPFTLGITTPDRTVTEAEALGYKRIKQTGSKFTRVIIFWSHTVSSTEPTDWDPTDPGDPNYNWASPDLQISAAAEAGLTPLVQIFAAPKWAERCQSPGEPGICNPDPEAFAQFAEAAAKRYSGSFAGLPRVQYWQPWNEPNLHIFFKPQRVGAQRPSPGLYRELVNRFAAVVKKQNPKNLVVGGGLAPLGGENSIGPLDFTRRLLCMKGRKKPVPTPGCNHKTRFDIWSVNPYTTGGPTKSAISPDDVQLGDVGEMRKLISAARKAGKIEAARAGIPLWVTEFSWDSKPPDPKGLPMAIHSRWTSEAMFRAWQAGVNTFFWFSLRDWEREPGIPWNQSLESGLWFRGNTIQGDRPKRSLRAFQQPFVAFRKPNGIRVWGRTPGGKAGKVVIRFGKGRNRVNRRIAVLRADKVGIFNEAVKTRLGKNKRGFVTATYAGKKSLPFSLKPVKDFYHPPFG